MVACTRGAVALLTCPLLTCVVQERSDTVLTLSAGCPVGDYYIPHDIDVPEELVSAVLPGELEGVTAAELVCET